MCIRDRVKGEVVVINPNNTKFQAPNFYLQAVGSKGNESTKGIHPVSYTHLDVYKRQRKYTSLYFRHPDILILKNKLKVIGSVN